MFCYVSTLRRHVNNGSRRVRISLHVDDYVDESSRGIGLYLPSAGPGLVGTSPSERVSVQDEEAGRGFHSAWGLSVCY